ncbi:ABC transporter substrate-binding protein [Aquisalimonas asiatica]|uniref:Branched-chain amino acid transport system substrate-binding protein n=1 Tax=Aquisalimonas asiatica TaxID=406100 RepID=A0A1H8QW99_9GAMM|nr:ABC transporter substrate-binding protein [Aquisalimonas asiatica]SEO58261.1 branched-chain amino acid transport system substrate-binding protein [Aquisalimonas asiatica]
MQRSVISLGILGLLATPLAAQADISDGEVRIGLISDMQSTYREVGEGAEVAAAMAVEDFGGEVLGNRIRVFSRDHELDADLAMEHARDLHENHNVDVFVGMVGSNTAIPIQHYAREHGIITLHTDSVSSSLTGEHCSPLGAHWMFDTYALAAGTTAALLEEGYESWHFVTADYSFGESLQADSTAVIEASDGRVVGTSLHPFQGDDFVGPILEAAASGADVIALANAGEDQARAIRTAYELGIPEGDQILAGLLTTEALPEELGLYVAQGLRLTTAWYWNKDDENRAWAERFQERSGYYGNQFGASVYSAVTHYLRAIEETGTDDPETVMEQMRAMPVDDIYGRGGELREDGRLVIDMHLARIKAPRDTEAAGDYYEILSTIPADQTVRPLDESNCDYLQ